MLLAVATAVPAFTRLGFWSGMTFAAVAVAGTAMAAGVLRAAGWAVSIAVAGLAGQPVIALAAAWQLYACGRRSGHAGPEWTERGGATA